MRRISHLLNFIHIIKISINRLISCVAGGKKEYVCMLCKKTFSVYRYYKRHLQTTSHQSKDGQDNYPLYKCELCYKVFPSHDALSRHNLRAHFGDKSLKCPLCDFRTSLAASLSRHVNLHTDNRKYICDQCGSCFHTLSALKDHTIYVHSNERNYSCEICGQRFKLKSGLNRHFKTHSDEKEFKCFCGQVYKFRTNLKRHLMNAHKVVIYFYELITYFLFCFGTLNNKLRIIFIVK